MSQTSFDLGAVTTALSAKSSPEVFAQNVKSLNNYLQDSSSEYSTDLLSSDLIRSMAHQVSDHCAPATIQEVYRIISVVLQHKPAKVQDMLVAIIESPQLLLVLLEIDVNNDIQLLRAALKLAQSVLQSQGISSNPEIFLQFLNLLNSCELLTSIIPHSDPRVVTVLNREVEDLETTMHKCYLSLNNTEFQRFKSSEYLNDLYLKVENYLTFEINDSSSLLSNFSILQLFDLFQFFNSSNNSFKKLFNEQLMFNNLNKNQIFPIVLASSNITDFVITEKSNVLNRELIHYEILLNFLKIWIDSNSEVADFENLFKLLSISNFKTFDYKELRNLQINNIKSQENYSNLKFDELLKSQIFELTKTQILTQLSKGFWVYSDVPHHDSHKSTNYYFVILSPNFKNLLYKMFKEKTNTKPNIDKVGTAIDIQSISNFHIEELKKLDSINEVDSNFVNLNHNVFINKITLLNRKNKPLFTFCAKREDSLLWVDGLNFLLKRDDSLSSSLKQQMNKLFKIRKTIQFDSFEGDDEEDEYDLNTLMDIV